jgi:predicted lipase
MNDNGNYVKNTLVFYSQSLNTLIISFAGSKNIEDWITDLDYETKKPSFTNDESIKAHSGMLTMYEGIRDKIRLVIDDTCNENTMVVITGHSLGAGLASICFYDVVENNFIKNRLLYTFASPRIGNPQFAEKINATNNAYRVANMEDIVTSFPFPVMGSYLYSHSGKMIPFSVNLSSIARNHTDAYSTHFDKDTE